MRAVSTSVRMEMILSEPTWHPRPHLSGDDLYMLARPMTVPNGGIRIFNWPRAWTMMKTNDELVGSETALTDPVSLPHEHETNRAEAACELPRVIAGGEPCCLVPHNVLGADRPDNEHTVWSNLLRQA